MKSKLTLFFPLMLIFGISAFAQTETQVIKIRAQVAAINKNIAKYKKTKKAVEGVSLEGTEGIFYSSGRVLKKAVANIYGETYNAVAEIYYDGDTPIFLYEKLNKYDKPLGATKSPKVRSIEETRIYYVDKQVIRILVGTKEVKSTDEKYEEIIKGLAAFPDDLSAAFKK